ncbi:MULTISPECIES: CHAT domain-containing protein [Microcystis]|uniref:CHAT domain-containing protein n=1 Tax=Microcystis viridis FACHB-1342 TaxID=2692900 RepID=A0ABR8GH18_MICVR|nr:MULTISPECIES: CHAT domain-containing tetratricopeptide repeat protein [Microcystis]MBD2602651.1 CHAT domain-containing protein [Microcystis viridis FACHB-1342]MDB9386504.1 CHAT domain-containing protein [Microcystis aeruginosa CS-583]ODV35570.1 Argininosuccinate lyase [Microcystis aeruginosa NIES-98]
MNEQRAQAYVNLIEQLLTSADGEEPNILQANQELIDPEFLQVMENYATWLEQQGNHNPVAWLRNMAQQLGRYLNRQAGSIEEYQAFLLEVLQAEAESNSDPTVVYPILQRRQHLLDDTFAQVLQQRARNVFSEWNAEEVAGIGRVIQYLCINIQQFSLGSRTNNLEIAITGYQALLEVYSRNVFSYRWASLQNSLGIAYSDRILGEKADNLELAIAAYNQSLDVFTREAFSEDWANLQNNLGCAYRNRIKGEKADNLELAIVALNQSLEVYTREAFPYEWARSQYNLGLAYRDRILGERAENIELAIAAFNQSLEVRNRDNFPSEWARTQLVLVDAYRDRILGERAENIELAITAFKLSLEVLNRQACPEQDDNNVFSQGNVAGVAGIIQNLCVDISEFPLGSRANNLEIAIKGYQTLLEVYTREAFPDKWATTQNNLGEAYRNRIRGERANNLELAITAHNLSLEVRTREAFPEDWAGTQNNLGNAYRERIRGERADNLELAIVALNQSLEVYTRDAFPEDWARSQNNLGAAYLDRIRGERADNLELAIEAFNLSLEVYTREAFPYEWARSQNNLGNVYQTRIKGEKADNLELAIVAYKLSLKVYTCDAFPDEWARSQNNLGNTYVRILGERIDNLEFTIVAYNLSLKLKVHTRDAFPDEWARSQNNFRNTHVRPILGEITDNLELAIAAYNQSLEVYTREAFPEYWARSQNNLGNAYLHNRCFEDRFDDREERTENLKLAINREERTENLKLAITAYNLSLEVYTPTAYPIYCLGIGRNLGNTANFIQDWETAIKGYNLAIEAVENTRLEALNPQRQQEILSEAMDVYHGIVQSYLNLNQPDRALEYVERSKTRYLVQLLTDRDIYPKGNIPQTIITELDRLRRAIIGEEQQLAIQEQTRNRGVTLTLDEQRQPILNDYTHLNKLKQELNQFIDREITKIDENFILTQTVKPIPFQDILSLTDAETCLLQWYITSEKILAFVVSADGNINLWESSEDDRDKLTDLINNYLQLYYSQNGHQEWINQLSDLLQTFSDTLHINDILTLIPNTCKRLIIIPYLFLHILPLHALPINHNQILQDKYDVQYAPSCQLFKITQQRQLNDLNSLFAIQNPQNNLLFTDLEVEIIKNLFVQSDILAKQNATEIAIKTHQNFPLANCIHFSCHGTFNPSKPLESALILTKEKTDQEDGYLRLGEIFELNFKNCRLVMLSACETGLIDLNSISDEYIGLPSGFLFAGSPSVVSSLWKVNDLSTAFLLIKFYETLPKNPKKGEIAVSLKNAQKWLQTLTLDQFEQELERFQLQLDKIINQLGGGKRPIFNESLKQIRQRQPYPFKNPYYWAGFIATGF